MKIRLATSVVLALHLAIGGCVEDFEDPLPPRDGLYYPIGMEVHPNGRFIYVVNSNFDLLYRDSLGGTVTVIDTETDEILGGSSPYLPSFGGHIALNADATKAYVTSREQDQVTVLSVANQGQALYCEVDGEILSDPRPCTVRRVPDTSDGARVPSDPFAVAVGQAQRTVGGETTNFDMVHLSHLRGEDVTSMSLPNGDIAGASMRSGALMQQGGNQLKIRPGTDHVYVAGRNSNRVEAYRPYLDPTGEVEAIIRVDSIRVTERQESIDARGLDFDANGDWLYVATRRPNALHVIGMDQGDGAQVVTSIPLEQNPSEVMAHRGADGVKRLYVPSYRHGIVEVVDPELEAVVDTIEVGRSPYHIVADSDAVHCQEPGQRCRAYVTLFDAGSDGEQRCDDDARQCGQVAIIDLDPASETFHTVIDTIE